MSFERHVEPTGFALKQAQAGREYGVGYPPEVEVPQSTAETIGSVVTASENASKPYEKQPGNGSNQSHARWRGFEE